TRSLTGWSPLAHLSSHVASVHGGRSPGFFACAVIGAGMVLFALLFVSLPTFAIKVTMPSAGLRIGLGLVHFLYDRWIYRFSDPCVRSTIGAELIGGGTTTARAG